MTALGRILGALTAVAVLTAWVLLTACLAVVAVEVAFDIVTGGLTP